MLLLPLPPGSNVESWKPYCSTKFELYHNQHCSGGGRGGTIVLSYEQSHNFCEGLWKTAFHFAFFFTRVYARKSLYPLTFAVKNN